VSVRLVMLGSSEAPAALALAAGQSAGLRARAEDVAALEAAGFREGPAAIECLVRAPISAARLSHRHRNAARSLRDWREHGLDLELTTMGAFGFDAFLEQVYFPIFTRVMFTRAITPYGAHEVSGLRALATDDTAVAIVRRGAEIAGAALLRRGTPIGPEDVVRGALPQGAWHEGRIYVLREELRSCQRALVVKLAEAVAARGEAWLSLGQDAVWCDRGYDTVLREKLHLADAVVYRFVPERRMYSWRPGEGERLVFFEWIRSDGRLGARNLGYDEARFAELRGALPEEDARG
jgi:hypothetical protein